MSELAPDRQQHSQIAVSPQQAMLSSGGRSPFQIYREFAVGNAGLLALGYYEFCNFFFADLTGLPGLAARAVFYPRMLKACGRKPGFGRGISLRNPGCMSFGRSVMLDEYVALDARGDKARIDLGDFVSVGRMTSFRARNSSIVLENGVNISCYCRIGTDTQILIGESTLIAAYVYIGPGNHRTGEGQGPVISSGMELKGGVKIGKHCWIGARATILDGVTIGDHAVVGAHALVREDVPAGTVVAGTPARIIRAAK